MSALTSPWNGPVVATRERRNAALRAAVLGPGSLGMRPQRWWCRGLERLEERVLLAGNVVINEIHYHPDVEYEEVEFLELTNAGDAVMDLSGAHFTDGVDYTFPGGTALAPGAYILVAGNPGDVMTKWGVTAYGPWTGKLSNDGEKVTLKSAGGEVLDTVTYGVGFPWPVTGDYGDSLELINPTFDNAIPGNWRGSNFNSQMTLLAAGSTWQYRKGTSEPPADWKNEGFDEGSDTEAWETGAAPIGFGDDWDVTILSDMQNNYSTIYVRNTFEITDQAPDTLTLRVFFDDGGIVYLNGTEVKRAHVSAGVKYYNSLAQDHEPSWETFTLTGMKNILHLGTNTIAIHELNAQLTSDDFCVDAQLIVPAGQYGTTPGAQNSVYATATPPLLDDLAQSVEEPVSGQEVTISIQASDPSGVQSVNLEYQLVNPGSYIRLTDGAYQNWTSVGMHDDGLNGDAAAGDGVYTYVMPGSLQTNRRLVRYRIRATNNNQASIVAPYATDPQPNFAYFVYDGVPAWTGANQPGITEPATFGTEITGSLPVYELIANSTDVANCQWNTSYTNVTFHGTMVYDGVVYDHITFQIRGESSTYVSGKNKWGFKFNTGHLFAARDNYGHLYAEKWKRIDLNANASPWLTVNRGMAGLDESLSYRLYQLAGMPAPNTNYVQFRVVEGVNEAPANQYAGDLWGLYLAVEYTGGHFLDEHGLEDGNVYKIENDGAGDARNISADQAHDGSDWSTFFNIIKNTTPTLEWWRENVDLVDSFSFQAINRAVSNIDLRPGWNHVMYHNPDGQWVIIPWDMDNVLVPKTHREGYTYLFKAVSQYPELQMEYANQARNLLDLLFSDKSTAGGQAAQLVDEYARFVNPSDGAGGYLQGWAEIDEYMWNYNPHTSTTPTYTNGNAQPVHRGAFYVTPQYNYRLGGMWWRTLSSPDFTGMVHYITDFMTNTDPDGWAINDGDQRGYGYNYLNYDATDPQIPYTPTVTYTGINGFPTDGLKFTASAYGDPEGSPFAAMEWRIGEISNPATGGFDPNGPWKYEIDAVWESGELTSFGAEMAVPSGILQEGHTYRLRVRFKDDTGRWSHWSDVEAGATEFVAGQPLDAVQNALRITELNYHPVDNTVLPGSSTDKEDYEFIEFENFGAQTINLQNLQFDAGITMTFGDVTLAPGELGVVTHNTAAFQSRYGTSIKVLGTYPDTKLDNAGEHVRLRNADLSILYDFTYDDTGTGWYPQTDGGGPSLVVRDPAAKPNLSDPASWRASLTVGGSPGIDETHPNVVGRHACYNQSVFDGNSPAAGEGDDAALASDKTALLPGQTATFANYTSYSRGINAIVVDLGGMTASLSASDFIFRVGNDDDPAGWDNAPPPLTVLNRSLVGGVARVEIVWEDNVIANQWLEVTLQGGAGSTSGLAADDVFYFGNAIGETGNDPAGARVDAIDPVRVRGNATATASITNRCDINRDGAVNASDELIARTQVTWSGNELHLITPGVAAPAAAVAPGAAPAPDMPQSRPVVVSWGSAAAVPASSDAASADASAAMVSATEGGTTPAEQAASSLLADIPAESKVLEEARAPATPGAQGAIALSAGMIPPSIRAPATFRSLASKVQGEVGTRGRRASWAVGTGLPSRRPGMRYFRRRMDWPALTWSPILTAGCQLSLAGT